MCSVVTLEAAALNRVKLSTKSKWIKRNKEMIPVSPATECIRVLSDVKRINGIKSKGMRVKREGKALVKMNDYASSMMDNVSDIPNYKIVFLKGKFNGMRAFYNICTDPDLGLGYADFAILPVDVLRVRSS